MTTETDGEHNDFGFDIEEFDTAHLSPEQIIERKKYFQMKGFIRYFGTEQIIQWRNQTQFLMQYKDGVRDIFDRFDVGFSANKKYQKAIDERLGFERIG